MGRRAEPRELNSIEDMIQALEPLTPDEAAHGVVLPEQLEAHAVEIRAPKPHVLPLIRAAEPSCPCPFVGTSFQKSWHRESDSSMQAPAPPAPLGSGPAYTLYIAETAGAGAGEIHGVLHSVDCVALDKPVDHRLPGWAARSRGPPLLLR
jgi:hypothetical protein